MRHVASIIQQAAITGCRRVQSSPTIRVFTYDGIASWKQFQGLWWIDSDSHQNQNCFCGLYTWDHRCWWSKWEQMMVLLPRQELYYDVFGSIEGGRTDWNIKPLIDYGSLCGGFMLLCLLGYARQGVSLVHGPKEHCTNRTRGFIHRSGESQPHEEEGSQQTKSILL